MKADAAVRGIRELDSAGSVGLLSGEGVGPYDRPPLSKCLWKGKDLESISRNTGDVTNVTLHLRTTAAQLDAEKRSITDGDGNLYAYEKLLLATGDSARRLPFGGESIIYFRTLDDYRRLRELTETSNRFAII